MFKVNKFTKLIGSSIYTAFIWYKFYAINMQLNGQKSLKQNTGKKSHGPNLWILLVFINVKHTWQSASLSTRKYVRSFKASEIFLLVRQKEEAKWGDLHCQISPFFSVCCDFNSRVQFFTHKRLYPLCLDRLMILLWHNQQWISPYLRMLSKPCMLCEYSFWNECVLEPKNWMSCWFRSRD